MLIIVFLIGLALTGWTARSFPLGDGLNSREFGVIILMASLTALALVLTAIIRYVEVRYSDDVELIKATKPEAEPETKPEADLAASLAPASKRDARSDLTRPAIREDRDAWTPGSPERAEARETLTRQWAIRPDQKLPPPHPDDLADPKPRPRPIRDEPQA